MVELVTAVRAVLGEQNADQTGGMWMVIPFWARFLFMNSELANASVTGDALAVNRTGRLVEIDGLTIYTSNLLHSAVDAGSGKTCWNILAGNKDAISFCAQMTKARAFEAQNTFGMIYDGLHVFDWKVIKPEGLVSILAYKA
jgi:hypothetical protein